MLATSRSYIAVFAALTVLSAGLLAAYTHAAEPTPGYNTKIPENIMTPDKVKTRIGTLEFFDGIPTKKTAALLYNNLDFMRGVETFLNGIPATSVEALRVGLASLGAKNSNQAVIFDQLMDSNPIFLTGNTDTVYCIPFLDLKKDGPTVIEIPPGLGPGTVNDAYFRFVIDMGPPGPDKGKGGKYLILPPDYEGDVPEGYFTAKSTSYVNWVALRGFLVDGKLEFSSEFQHYLTSDTWQDIVISGVGGEQALYHREDVGACPLGDDPIANKDRFKDSLLPCLLLGDDVGKQHDALDVATPPADVA